MIKKIDSHLSAQEIQHHIAMVLHNLPLKMRNVFELYTVEHLELEEIAQVRNNTREEVEELLREAKKAVQLSFLNRYSISD
jgi:DNA-directed RNA polymerase specialized sigma24 family protein